MMHGYEYGWGMMGGGMWLGLLLLVLLIVGLVYALNNANRSSTAGKSAREILDERYARGEIDKEEYQQKKQDLTQ